ncbi:MAG TPA: transporter substrate-binding domain-containing protein, partial [Desulfobulbus sp.]|nr:transporter substrate-binding domain-containing protein [Desulfobulbus sp.]
FLNSKGEPKGIFPEILEEIAQKEDWQITWVPGTWKQGLARLESGEIDIMPDVAFSLERAEKYTFSDEPVFINWGTFYTRPGIPPVKAIPDLAGKRVAVMRGSIHTDGKEGIRQQVKQFNVPCTIVEFDSYQDVFQALQANLADVGVVNRLYGATSQRLYDVLPTTVAFNPRHLKFVFPPDGDKTPYLKERIDFYLKAAHEDPRERINVIIQSYLAGVHENPSEGGKHIYLTPEEEAWIAAHPNISIGIDPEFSPFEFIDKNGRYSGYSSDYIQLLNQRLGLNMKIAPGLSWKQVMDRASRGKIDILPAVGISKKRSEFLLYTTPYIGFHRMIFCRSDVPFVAGLDNISGLRVAVQANSSHAAWLREHTNLKPEYYDTLQQTLEAVAAGKADVLIGNLAACTYWIRKLNITTIRIGAPVSQQRQLLYMAVKKEWPQLVSILNKGLASITAEEAETIRNRWTAAGYSVGLSAKIFWQRILLIILAACTAVGFFWFWNNRLQQEVKRRVSAETGLLEYQEQLVNKVADRTRELEENKNYLQEIFDAPSEAIFIHNAETGAILDVNKTMLQLFGLTYQEALQATIADLSAGSFPYTQQEAEKKIQLALSEGPQTFEWLSKKKNGELFWTEIGLTLTKIGDRSYVIAVVRNIDARKKAAQVLANEQERLAVTLRSIADGVITTDIHGRISILNKVAEELTGWTYEEARGRDFSDVFHLVNQKTGLLCKSPVDKVLQHGQVTGLDPDATLITRDGRRKSIADSGAPIRDNNSEIIGVVLVFRDVTNEKKLEKELLKIRKLEAVGVLAGGIAHDFNNILSAISGNIELTAQLIGDEHKGSPLLGQALKATFRATRLTHQLLTFAKGGDPVKETTSLPQLIRDSADFVLRGSSVSCEYTFADDLQLVDIDPGQMSQVIQNIIINGRQAMPEGGRIQIRAVNTRDTAVHPMLGIHGDKAFVKISIQDSGAGIPESILDKIFDPYFSTKQEGSGLGLAICHSIISKHGGFITAQSTPGEGTTFTLYLPASEQSSLPTDAVNAENATAGSHRILLMDDDEMLRTVASSQLEHLGHTVITAEDGAAAVACYQKHMHTKTPIDLTIMDLTIPGGMGGKEAVQEILALNPEARVIVTSGYSNDPVMANFRQYGFQASLLKPFD